MILNISREGDFATAIQAKYPEGTVDFVVPSVGWVRMSEQQAMFIHDFMRNKDSRMYGTRSGRLTARLIHKLSRAELNRRAAASDYPRWDEEA